MIYTLGLSYTRPPLSLNYRQHWAVRARITRDVRDEIILRCRAERVPALQAPPAVTLHYRPATTRRRDVDSLVALSKACLDGIVAAGILTDDTPAHVKHMMPVIHWPAKPGSLWVEVDAA